MAEADSAKRNLTLIKTQISMNNKKTTTQRGIQFLGLLSVVFFTLKVTNVVTWPWLVVLVPLWGPITLLSGGAALSVAVVLSYTTTAAFRLKVRGQSAGK